MVKHGSSTTQFRRQPDLTKLIESAADDADACKRLAELVCPLAIARINKFLRKLGYTKRNIQAEEVLDALWVPVFVTAIKNVKFNDRDHFLNVLLKHARYGADKLANQFQRISKREKAFTDDKSPLSKYIDPSVIAADHDTRDHTNSVLKTLESPQREIVLLFAGGMEIRPIAELLGMKKSTVHDALKKALHKLKEKVRE